MKLLLIHNSYGTYSGEEAVVDQQISLFNQMGHKVDVYRKTTEGVRGTMWGNLKGLLSGFYAPSAVRDIKRLMKVNKPDLVIIHNLYPFISPAVLKPIKKSGVPIIMTVHNYRLMCPTGLFMRDYKPCELCLKGREWNCIQHNCEWSILKSIGYASRNWYARITKAYLDHIDLYACITQFQIEKLVQAGFDSKKLVHVPNFLSEISQQTNSVRTNPGEYVAISGRISEEKGIDLALYVAIQTPDIQYVFAGSLRNGYEIRQPLPDNCTFLGHVSKDRLEVFYRNARFLLNMSYCYEGFPMTILEAASYGKPAIGPSHAGFLEIIDNHSTGLLFTPGDVNDLQEKISQLWNNQEACIEMGRNAFLKLNNNYTATIVQEKWKELFSEITAFKKI